MNYFRFCFNDAVVADRYENTDGAYPLQSK